MGSAAGQMGSTVLWRSDNVQGRELCSRGRMCQWRTVDEGNLIILGASARFIVD
jgi:hypothetical protein